MKEHPILFSGEMVRAILEGRKTQTRRVVKWPEWVTVDNGEKRCADIINSNEYKSVVKRGHCDGIVGRMKCPYGVPGDRLWVRETCSYYGYSGGIILRSPTNDRVWRPDNNLPIEIWGPFRDRYSGKFCPSIHMPRWASRIQLRVVDIRVERLNEISEEDAIAEGCISTVELIDGGNDYRGLYAQEHFQILWDSINKKRGYGWDTNPWVWVVEFERI
jgi:hypothetical protein